MLPVLGGRASPRRPGLAARHGGTPRPSPSTHAGVCTARPPASSFWPGVGVTSQGRLPACHDVTVTSGCRPGRGTWQQRPARLGRREAARGSQPSGAHGAAGTRTGATRLAWRGPPFVLLFPFPSETLLPGGRQKEASLLLAESEPSPRRHRRQARAPNPRRSPALSRLPSTFTPVNCSPISRS